MSCLFSSNVQLSMLTVAGMWLGLQAHTLGQQLRAGASQVDITPQTLPVETAGSMTPHLTDQVHDPLMARCLVLDNGSVQLALVVCDSCMIPHEIFDAAKNIAEQKTGIPASNMLFSANHSHSAVCVARVFQSTPDTQYAKWLTEKIADAVSLAFDGRETARIGWALSQNPAQVFNRRWFLRPGNTLADPFDLGTDRVRMNPGANQSNLLKPAGPTDPGVPVLAVQSKSSGRPIAIWANYSLHYVGGIPGGGLSGDYFGQFSKQFVQLINAQDNAPATVAAMTNGTSGDINNINFFEGTVQNRKPFEQIEYVASELARSVKNAYDRIEFLDYVPLQVVNRQLELKVRKPDAAEIDRAKQILSEAGVAPYKQLPQIYANETMHMADFPAQVQVPLQALRIGDVGIAATPCETFVETGLAIKEHSPLPLTFTIELANGYNGYLPTPQQHALGGYETWRAKSSYLAVDAEPKVRAALLEMLNEVARDQRPPQQLSQAVTPAMDALAMIESTRGGRHWVDQPVDPPKSPEESLACFQIEPGLRVELVAAEPLVFDPVWIAFDHLGNLFAAEYCDYPTGPTRNHSSNAEPEPLSRIVMLTDSDLDGRMDTRTVFADRLNFAHSFMPFREGLLVGAHDQILYLRDTNGDHMADTREVLFQGFQPAHPQMQIGCPVWGMNNWIYWTYGPGTIQRNASSLAGQSVESLQTRRDFKFHWQSLDFAPTSGLGQFGNTINAWGDRFYCTNRNPIITAPMEPEDFARNRFLTFANDQYDVAPSGQDSLVLPIVPMRSNYLSHAGTHTAACGTTAYTGDLLGDSYRDNVFVCEPIGHLITRSKVHSHGSTLKANRVDSKQEFLASTDTWFRPASLACGPDGALYIADMYRLWVEHPKFLPAEIAAKLDWRAGEDRGRIWRIVPEGTTLSARFQSPQSVQQLVSWLADRNGWKRELAQRLLVERQSKQAVPMLRSLIDAQTTSKPSSESENDESLYLAAQRALWVLDGLNELDSADVLKALRSPHGYVRMTALRLAERFAAQDIVFRAVLNTATDNDPRVRRQAAITLGAFTDSLYEADSQQVARALATILSQSPDDTWTGTAILTSAQSRSATILAQLYDMYTSHKIDSTPEVRRVIRDLAASAAASGVRHELEPLLQLIHHIGPQDRWWQYSALLGLASGLTRQSNFARSLPALLSTPPEGMESTLQQLSETLKSCSQLAVDSQVPLQDRLAAIELLHLLPNEQSQAVISRLFQSSQPTAIQLAVLQQMRQRSDPSHLGQIIDRWPELLPEVRTQALALLLQRGDSIVGTLQAMLDGKLSAASISVDQRATLLSSTDQRIASLAQKVFGSGISPDRHGILRDYQAALHISGDAAAGKLVFAKSCSSCHRVGDVGHDVGPDLSDTRSRSREALLMDLIDPNQKLEPKYTAYQVLTVDGQVLHGLLVQEDPQSVVLKLAEAKLQTIARDQIEQLVAHGKSLMPEGMEKDINLQQMADLLEFLKR